MLLILYHIVFQNAIHFLHYHFALLAIKIKLSNNSNFCHYQSHTQLTAINQAKSMLHQFSKKVGRYSIFRILISSIRFVEYYKVVNITVIKQIILHKRQSAHSPYNRIFFVSCTRYQKEVDFFAKTQF